MSEQTPTAPAEASTGTAVAPATTRKFVFEGTELVDIDTGMTPEQIRDFWSGTYPALQNAKIKGPDVSKAGGVEVKSYTFVRHVGTLG